MTEENSTDQFIGKLNKHPISNGLAGIFATAATADFLMNSANVFGMMTLAGMLVSPPIAAVMGIYAGVNLFRERSMLSKAFSLAAATSVVAGVVAMGAVTGSAALASPIFTLMAVGAAGILNSAAHYTKDIHLTAKVSVTKPDVPDIP